jgi:hypothetical protein
MVATPSGRDVRLKGKLPSTACDGAGVSGGSATLSGAIVELRGRFPEGTDCASLLGSIGVEKGELHVKWLGDAISRPRHHVPLGVSNATIASADFDSGSGSFVIVTAPIAKGDFAGSTLTLTLPLGDVSEYTRICNLPDGGGYSAFIWGPPMNDASVTLSVQ